MPDVLDFNPNRDLTFNSARDRDFDPGRKLVFDANRNLLFNSDRGLPFGRRGVVFRGFVCPICGVGVTEDQPSCTECGAVFDRVPAPKPSAPPARPAPPPPPAQSPGHRPPLPPAAAAPHRPPPPVRAYPPSPKTVDFERCPYCGARVATGDAFCWSCGNRMHRGGA